MGVEAKGGRVAGREGGGSVTRHLPQGCIRRPSAAHDLPEMSTPDEPEDAVEQDDDFDQYEADGGDCAPRIGNER